MTMQVPNWVLAQSFPAPVSGTLPVNGSRAAIVPSLRLAERYDSNVFFVPGGNADDYVTTVSPQIRTFRKNDWIEGIAGAGATAEVYAKNPGLNYVGGNGIVKLNLDGAMNALIKGLSLHLFDAINYTPQPPAFAAPTGGGQIPEPFVQGIQARRANSLTNIASAELSYFFSPFIGITSTFVDKRVRFGKPVATPGAVTQEGFRNTTFQTLTSGPVVRLSETDTISISHLYSKGSFSDPDIGDSGFFTHGANAKWIRSITADFKISVEGGFSVMGATGNTYPVGSAALDWEGQYTTVQITYSRGIVPSFLTLSTPLLSNAVTVKVRRELAEPFSVMLNGSYAVNESIPDSSILRFESYMVGPSLEYKIGKLFTLTLSYVHSQFQRGSFGQSFDFDREVVMFSLLSEWR